MALGCDISSTFTYTRDISFIYVYKHSIVCYGYTSQYACHTRTFRQKHFRVCTRDVSRVHKRAVRRMYINEALAFPGVRDRSTVPCPEDA